MAHQQFKISNVNPNDTMGGGGCVCDPRKQVDCKPPYVVFHTNEMLDPLSPHPVICESCLLSAACLIKGEALEIGERGTSIPSAAPTPTPESQARRSPVVESPDPRRDFADDTPDI